MNKLKDSLEGIAALAFRIHMNQSTTPQVPNRYRVKNGSPVSRDRHNDFYLTTEESDDPSREFSIDTGPAIENHLTKRAYHIHEGSDGVLLTVWEWDWRKDGLGNYYRKVWERAVSETGASREVAQMIADTLKRVGA